MCVIGINANGKQSDSGVHTRHEKHVSHVETLPLVVLYIEWTAKMKEHQNGFI